jgi:hypothetical protein
MIVPECQESITAMERLRTRRSLPAVILTASPDSIKWTDEWTAVGTVALAAVTVATVIVTVFLARRDRKDQAARLEDERRRGEVERAAAEQRLREERDLADERLREERDAAERQRFRERQINIAAMLMERIAALHPFWRRAAVPAYQYIPGRDVVAEAAEAAIESLQAGARSDALMLGDPVCSQLYITLARLVASAHTGQWLKKASEALGHDLEAAERNALVERTTHDLRRYSRYVRLWLAKLIAGEPVPEEAFGPTGLRGAPDAPFLNGQHATLYWSPMLVPDGWQDDTSVDADDPQFRPM